MRGIWIFSGTTQCVLIEISLELGLLYISIPVGFKGGRETEGASKKILGNTVFSPDHGLVGFPQEKLRWCIKSQEDAPVWVQGQATCQTDFRVGTLE